MLNYKDKNNEIYTFDENGNEEFRNKKIEELGLISVTDEEIAEIREQKDIDNQVAEKKELNTLLSYLSETDWVVVKCYELGLTVSEEYPDIYALRVAARTQINELQAQLESL